MEDSVARDDQALELRSKGRSFSEIARILGYTRASHANEAFRRALGRKPDAERTRLRDQELTRLSALSDRIRATAAPESDDATRQIRTIDRLRALLMQDA